MRAKQFIRKINEAADESGVITTEVIKLISDGHTEVSPDVITAKVSAALGRPFMLKDLVSANNASPELQHYIDSINPSKIKFSTDILTVKNQDPMKEKQAAQDGVAKMAAKAASRPRLGESVNEGWGSGSDRVQLPDGDMGYWNGTGPLQKEYEELYDKLVPAMGAADTIQGEVLRAASKIYYRHHNDGDDFNAASFKQLEPYIGKVSSYDDLAHKATEYAIAANGNYTPNNNWDSLDVMDYGPEDYSDDYDEDDDYEDEWYEEPEEDEEEIDEGAADQVYTVDITRRNKTRSTSGTIPELLEYFGYTLEVGKSYEHERGRYKINMTPKNIQSLVDNLNKAASNGAANGAASTYYEVGGEVDEGQDQGLSKDEETKFHAELDKLVHNTFGKRKDEMAESAQYSWSVKDDQGKGGVYHRVAQDEKVIAQDIAYTKKTNPHAKVVATKNGKPFDWESVLGEGWESGPEEPRERPEPDPDDWYDQKRQEKLDIEAEKELERTKQAKLTYKLNGRGPNMEPNYDFGMEEFNDLEAALAARERLMADPKTPNPRDIGIQTIKRYVPRTDLEEGLETPLRDLEDYNAKRKALQDIQLDPHTHKDPELSTEVIRRLAGLEKQKAQLNK